MPLDTDRVIPRGTPLDPTSILHINATDINLRQPPRWNSTFYHLEDINWGDWCGWAEVHDPNRLVTFQVASDEFTDYIDTLGRVHGATFVTVAPFELHSDTSTVIARLAYLLTPPWTPRRNAATTRADTRRTVARAVPGTDPTMRTAERRHVGAGGIQPIIPTTTTTTGDTAMPINYTTDRHRDARGRFTSLSPLTDRNDELAIATVTTQGPLYGRDRIARPTVSGRWVIPYRGTCPHCLTSRSAVIASDSLGCHVCHDCFNAFHVECDSCGVSCLRADAETSDDWHHVTGGWNDYWRCNYCYHDDDDVEGDDFYEDNGVQWTESARRMLVGYHYRPILQFTDWAGEGHQLVSTERLDRGDHRLFMGVELETELMQAPSAYDVLNKVLNGRRDDMELFAAKTDGSLNNGIEFVSMPMTMEAWRHVDLGWMQDIADMGVRCWDTTTAGLHVHCSVSAFKTRSHFVRWWMLYEKNPPQWVKLAGRHNRSYAKWDRDIKSAAVSRAFKMMPFDPYGSPHAPKAPDYNRGTQRDIERAEFERRLWVKYHPNKLPQKASSNGDRYVALNAQNEHTVEQRFWRPSLRHTTLLATLEAIQASFDYTYQLGELNSKAKLIDKIELLHWDHFRAWVKAHAEDYPYLDARIALRFKELSEDDNDPTDK